MRTVYLDSNFMCHAVNDGAMQAVETEAFDSLCEGALACYRFVPSGQTWTRPNGRVIHGPFIQAVNESAPIQRQYEFDEAAYLVELGSLIEDLYNADLEVIG